MNKKGTGSYLNGIGKGGERGMQTAYFTPGLAVSKELSNMQSKILDIEIPSKESPSGLCVLDVSENASGRRVAVSLTKAVSSSKVDTRPHTIQNGHIMNMETFYYGFKDHLDSLELDKRFYTGSMNSLDEQNFEKKIGLKEVFSEKCSSKMSEFWISLTEEQRWNLFTRLFTIIVNNRNNSWMIDAGKWDPRNVQADFYRCLPVSLAMKLTSLSCGMSQQHRFHVIFKSDKPYKNEGRYRAVKLEELYENAGEFDGLDYTFLCRIVVSPKDSDREEFYEWLYKMGVNTIELKTLDGYAAKYLLDNGCIMSEEIPAEYLTIPAFKNRNTKIGEEPVIQENPVAESKEKKSGKQEEVLVHSEPAGVVLNAQIQEPFVENTEIPRNGIFEDVDIEEVEKYLHAGTNPITYIHLRQRLLSPNMSNERRNHLRMEIREFLYDVKVKKGREEAFVHLVMLAFAQTDEEFLLMRKNQFEICESGPYYVREIGDFLIDTAVSEIAYKKYINIFTKLWLSSLLDSSNRERVQCKNKLFNPDSVERYNRD